jgi:hypothetical protein
MTTAGDPPRDPPADESDQDPDRAAILARRRRFITIALSGLATGAACADPCLKVGAHGDDNAAENQRPPPAADPAPATPQDPETSRPEACLKVSAPPPEQPVPARPEACLKVAPPPQDPADTKAIPRPCLSIHRPDPPKPSPKPCLRVARPSDE